jgi:hypothetical protein
VAAAGEPTAMQLTQGPMHHFYGYIGHVGNTPWSGDDRHLVLLRTAFQDHMPAAGEAADIVLLDTQDGNRVRKVDETRAWNFQQGTMLYWHPKARSTQFFFNDRDPATGHIFCVRYDISTGTRLREYRFEDTPVGNSGMLPDGEHFLALNYGRLARLRPVTGYPESFDWTDGAGNPENDGVWRVNVESGEKELLVSYAALARALQPHHPQVAPLFINHTLASRDGSLIYGFARAGWFGPKPRPPKIDAPFTLGTDGTGLVIPLPHIGGHPEWSADGHVVGSRDGRQILFDPRAQQAVRMIGTPESIPDPGADVAISPDGKWLVNGWHEQEQSCYRFIQLETGETIDGPCLPVTGWTEGDLRIDPAPCWNRAGTAIAVPALAPDGTRQTFLVQSGDGCHEFRGRW